MTPEPVAGPLLIDAHVHVQREYDPGRMLSAALANGRAAAERAGLPEPSVALVIADAQGQDGFARLQAGVPGWTSLPTEEEASLRLRGPAGAEILVFAGRQMATGERLEVLSLLCPTVIPDGLPLGETVERVREVGGVPVIPWGFGKWSMRRKALLESWISQAAPPVFLGDSGGRPAVLGVGDLFATASARRIWNLPGSDPLPLAWEEDRAGSCGFVLPEGLPAICPAEALRAKLLAMPWQPPLVGRRRSITGFLRSQIGLRLPRAAR